MNNQFDDSDDDLPLAVDIHGPGKLLADSLLAGKLISYTDDRFQVSSGDNSFIFTLVQKEGKYILFYAQVPRVYPLPDDLKNSIKTNIEAVLQTIIDIDFINAGTQAQRLNVQHSSIIGD